MGAMVTNHVYNKEHNTTEVNTNLTASKLPANSSFCRSLGACVCRLFKQSTGV